MQFSKKFLVSSLLLVAVVVLVGMLAPWNGWRAGNAADGETPAGADNIAEKAEKAQDSLNRNKRFSGSETPIKVNAGPVVRGDLIKRVSAQGRVHAYQNIEIQNEVAGRVLALLIKDGSRVKKGQIIARIDNREYEAALAEAEANLTKAQADYIAETQGSEQLQKKTGNSSGSSQIAKLKEQLASGLISKADYETKKQQINLDRIEKGELRREVVEARTMAAARAAYTRAELNLEKCTVRAPFNGVIFEVEAAQGQILGGGTKLARLVNMTDLVVKVQVLESEIGQIFDGRAARIQYPALPDLDWVTGKVQAISPLVNAEEKTVETIIAFKNVDNRIRPGMFAEAKIDAEIFEDRLMVPKEAILPRDNRKVVFKVGPDNRAKWLYVKTGEENEEFIEITDGKLDPGDMVLTDNHFTMGHDTLVKIAKKKP